MSPSSKDAYQGINSFQSSGSEDHMNDASASKATSFNLTQRPESQSQVQRLGSSSPTSSSGLQQIRLQHEDKDPFTSPGIKQKPEQKLSATASAFQPFMFRMNTQTSHGEASSRQQVSFPPTPFIGYFPSNTVVAPGSVNATPAKVKNSQTGAFSTDTRVTRALRISGIYVPATREQVESCLQVSPLRLSSILSQYYKDIKHKHHILSQSITHTAIALPDTFIGQEYSR